LTGVTDDDYKRMVESYVREQTVAAVMEAGGVSRLTARKYIEHGAPKLGRPSIRSVYAAQATQAAAATARETVYDLAKANDDTVKLARSMKGLLARQIQKMATSGELFRDPVRALEVVAKVETLALGGATDVLKLQAEKGPGDPLADLTDDELFAFIEAGMAVLKLHQGVRLQVPPAHTAATVEVVDQAAAVAA